MERRAAALTVGTDLQRSGPAQENSNVLIPGPFFLDPGPIFGYWYYQ
jgi:hypothetical protein